MLKIEFSTNNASFCDDDDDTPAEDRDATTARGHEVARILVHLAELADDGYTSGLVQDTNGNTVGSWYLTDD